jgi:hypothetical protein
MRNPTQHIVAILQRIITDKGEDAGKYSFSDETAILSSLPIDSLDLAGLVVEMELLTGTDPFADGFINFNTIGEFAALYAPRP